MNALAKCLAVAVLAVSSTGATVAVARGSGGPVHGVSSSSVAPWPWSVIGDCETTGPGDGLIDWSYNGRSGFDGGLQWLPATWSSAARLVAGARRFAFAWQAPADVQVAVARAWLRVTSWRQWPSCARAAGLL